MVHAAPRLRGMGYNGTMKSIDNPSPFASGLRSGALQALRAGDPSLAEAAMADISRAKAELDMELSKARALQMVIRLELAFRERPEIQAIKAWARGLDFGVALRSIDIHGVETVEDRDRALDPAAVEFYATAPDWAGREPDYESEDFIDGPFHKAFETFIGRGRGCPSPLIDAPWLYNEGTDWIERSDALGIADALDMQWMRSWVEQAEICGDTPESTAPSAPRRNL